MVSAVNKVDQVNFVLVLLAGVIAHILPFEALLISYAFLGPAHYLTEISWLHDRQYFTKRKNDIYLLLVLSLATLYASDSFGLMLMFTFFLAVSMAFKEDWFSRIGISVFCTLTFVLLNEATPSIHFFVMLPTLVHVFLFTFMFVLVGALRNNSTFGYMTLVAMIVVGLSFFVGIFPEYYVTDYGKENHMSLYDGIYKGFMQFTGLENMNDPFVQKALGFVGFAYTYHYLNWFSKTKVIKWNEISRKRLYSIVVLYFLAIGSYLYDYTFGFSVLLLLSWLHVVLEFPLNGVSASMIGNLTHKKMMRKVTA